jgi:hypothetical protein
MSAMIVNDENEPPHGLHPNEVVDLTDRALLQRLVNPVRHKETPKCCGIQEGQARVRRTLAEVNALERLAWRSRVTLLLAEADLIVEFVGMRM